MSDPSRSKAKKAYLDFLAKMRIPFHKESDGPVVGVAGYQQYWGVQMVNAVINSAVRQYELVCRVSYCVDSHPTSRIFLECPGIAAY